MLSADIKGYFTLHPMYKWLKKERELSQFELFTRIPYIIFRIFHLKSVIFKFYSTSIKVFYGARIQKWFWTLPL
jgi:hypothetical protein